MNRQSLPLASKFRHRDNPFSLDLLANISIFLALAIPLILYFAHNIFIFYQIDYKTLASIFPLVIIFIVLTISAIIFKNRTENGKKALYIFLFYYVLFFSYHHIIQLLIYIGVEGGFRHINEIKIATLILSILLSIYIFYRYKTPYIQLYFIGFVFLIYSISMYQIFSSGYAIESSVTSNPGKRLSGPNIYYFILDGHPSSSDQKFPNAGLARMEAQMQGLHFEVFGNGSSNHSDTEDTLASIMRLNYPSREVYRKVETRDKYPYSAQLGKPPELLRMLQREGYTLYSAQSGAFGCVNRHMTCLLDDGFMRYRTIFSDIFIRTPIGSWKRLFQSLRVVNAFEVVTDNQQELIDKGRPFFVWAHYLSPHPPYFYQKNCSRPEWSADFSGGWSTADGPKFEHETKCLGRDIVRMAKVISSRDPNALIILQADHGPMVNMDQISPKWKVSDWPEYQIQARLSFLNLVRAPANCKRPSTQRIGQINTARFVVNCALGRQLPYLPEVSLFKNRFRPETLLIDHAKGTRKVLALD